MSNPETNPAASPSEQSPVQGSTPGFSVRNVLLLVIPLSLIVGAVGGYLYFDATREADRPPGFESLRASLDTPEKLEANFTDADSDLVADPPTDASKFVDPDVLVFSTLGDDLKAEEVIWKDFLAHLKKLTGKEVKLAQSQFLNRQQAARMSDGSTHVVSLSTGNVPLGVTVGGFVPVCVMGDTEGKWGYHMEIIAPAGSPVNSLQDLRGKRLALANLRSHSGFKNAMVTLWTNLGMLPGRDYQWFFAGTQGMAIQAVKNKQCDAAAVASDFLKREVAAGRIAESDFRRVFTSPKAFPPACFGYVYNLKPDLAAKVREAFLTFPWAGSSLEKAYPANQRRFVPISYKDDWAYVREVDAQMKQLAQQTP